MDAQSKSMKMVGFIQRMKSSGVSTSNIVTFLKSLSLDDAIISRIIARAGA